MSDSFLIRSLPWLLPLILLLLKFILKLWVAEPHSNLNLWKAVLQSPVDIGFLSLSLIASAIIRASGSATGNAGALTTAFVIFIVFIALIVISILLWKVTPTSVTKREIVIASAIAIVNYGLSIAMLVYGVILIKPL